MPPAPTKPKLKRKSSHRDPGELDGTHAPETGRKRNSRQMACAECTSEGVAQHYVPMEAPPQAKELGMTSYWLLHAMLPPKRPHRRVVLAATEHLHHQLAKMRERIRQLEEALSELQAKHSTEPHPLLQPDLFESSQRDDGAGPLSAEDVAVEEHTPELVEALGTLSISDGGTSRFFGPTGGSHCLLMSFPTARLTRRGIPTVQRYTKNISRAFPFKPHHLTPNIEDLVSDCLPTWERARYLIEVCLNQAVVLSQSLSKDHILSELLPAYYTNGVPHVSQAETNPHQLALLFLIFAVGALLDPDQEPRNMDADFYHQVARAAICLQSVIDKPSLETVQALRLLSLYNGVSGNELAGKETSTETWSLVALAALLAHRLGLHRDGLRWGLPADIIARRRVVFWELYVADVWNSLEAGRPPTLSLPYTDCQFPGGGSPHDKVNISSDRQPVSGSWIYRFTSDCVADVAARTLTSGSPSYSSILELDRKVSSFPVTEAAEEFAAAACGAVPAKFPDKDIGLMESMGRLIMSNAREAILLYIHRSYFVQAITANPVDPLNSPYTPSFLAAHRASLTILRTVKVQYDLHPKLTARLWPVWTYAFSAAVVFGTIVTRGPRSPMASGAVKELYDACLLFTKASSHSRRAQKALPLVSKLTEKAHNALLRAQSDVPYELGQQWGVAENEGDDDVDIFTGRMKKLVSMKRQTTDRMLEGSSNSDGSARRPNSSVLMLQQKQSQAEPVVPRLYSCERLGSTCLQQPGFPAETTQEMSALNWTLYPDASSQSTLIQPPPTPLQIPPHVQANTRVSTFGWTLYPNASSQSTFIQPPPAPLQIFADVPLQASSHGGPVVGPSMGPWQSELSDPYSMTNLSAPSAQAYFQAYHPDYHRYDQYGHRSTLSASSVVSYYDDPLASTDARRDYSRPQPLPCTHPHTDTQPHPHHQIQSLPCEHQPNYLHPPQFQLEPLVPPELAQVGLVVEESGLDRWWTSFMHNSGFLDGDGYEG
ncbi:fungal-specific transcription factor domain-containing protein [Pisolithus marmoratus]|nr:fungal-specific transcription factor domain-containing protein [Pisolithus marmoratus]